MKLLRVINSMNLNFGGPSQGIRNINPFLKKINYHLEVVCLDDKLDEYKDDGLIIHRLGKGISSYSFNYRLKKWLKKHIVQFDYIIIHGIWQYHNYAIYSTMKNLKKKNINLPKIVIMPHGMLDPYFQNAPERRLKAFRNEIIWRLSERRSINAADAVFFTCQDELELARTTFKGYKPKREINVGYGIQSPPSLDKNMRIAFEKCCPNIKDNNYWLFLSRLHPKKGLDMLILAYNELSELGYNLPDLVIAGSTDSNYAYQMINLAKQNPKIHFTGMLSGDSKWGAFYGCDIFILPSHQENFGIAIVEAMACKKPVVITKNVNIWREINEGNGGWIIDQPNKSNIKEILVKLAAFSKNEIVNRGANAFNTFNTHFLVDKSYLKFIGTLKSL